LAPERIHVSLDPLGAREAAVFVSSALLVSHGVRGDSTAIARLSKPRAWLLVSGKRVRHLRPDMDSSLGWVRAVITGNRRLGGAILSDLDLGAFRDCEAICFHGAARALAIPLGSLRECVLLAYSSGSPVSVGCRAEYPLGPLPVHLGPVIGNVLLDRFSSGLQLLSRPG